MNNQITLADKYFLKAREDYPYDMDMVVDNLGYALSYDGDHAPAWCLQGQIQMEQLKDYEAARHSFEMAILANPQYVDAYKYYSMLLIWIGDIDKALALVDRAEGIAGMSKSIVHQRRATAYECQGRIRQALDEVRKGQLFSMCDTYQSYFADEAKRLRSKVAPKRKKHKKATKAVKK